MIDLNISPRQKILDAAGGVVDRFFLSFPKIAMPFKPVTKISKDDYEKQLDFYIDNGYTEKPASFFSLPSTPPDYRVIEEKPYYDGKRQVVSFPSQYDVANPLIKDSFNSYTANQTGYFVRWTHNDTGRKTVLCLHGFMLGEPDQAERMFGVKKLFKLGLDVALFITPFHWRRAPEHMAQRGIFLQANNVPMTCECFGQAISDLDSTILALYDMGADKIGLIGASLGGYNASLYACLSDSIDFAALIVPAVSFSEPYSPDSIKMPFTVDEDLQKKAMDVWRFHEPYRMSPRLAADKVLVVAARGDRLCLFKNVKTLCDSWKIENYQFLTGGHWLIFNNQNRGKAWFNFLTKRGFL